MPAFISGAVVTVASFGVAVGVTVYNRRWIDEYNEIAGLYDYWRTRNAAYAQQLQDQGREHQRIIDQNNAIATAFYVVGGVGLAFTVGSLIFWPRETVPATQARIRLLPTPNGVVLGGTF